MKRKNPHAVALGRKGGKARLTKMTPEQRSAIASLGGKAAKLAFDKRNTVSDNHTDE